MARAQLMAAGVRLPFRGFEEALAMSYINRERQIQQVEILAAMADPSKAEGVLSLFNTLVFPGERDRKIKQLRDGKKVLQKLKEIKIYAKPS